MLEQEDDREIKEEGVDSLTDEELRQACRARGMRAPFGEGAAAFMRDQVCTILYPVHSQQVESCVLLNVLA